MQPLEMPLAHDHMLSIKQHTKQHIWSAVTTLLTTFHVTCILHCLTCPLFESQKAGVQQVGYEAAQVLDEGHRPCVQQLAEGKHALCTFLAYCSWASWRHFRVMVQVAMTQMVYKRKF